VQHFGFNSGASQFWARVEITLAVSDVSLQRRIEVISNPLLDFLFSMYQLCPI